MNSSPAEFLSANIDGYFSSFGIPSNYDFGGGGGGSGGGGSSVDVSSSGKRLRENDSEQHSPNFSCHRRGEQGGQLSTASSLVEMETEKLLEDSVPCRVRAKRGCATHPRSIAERVRRTRISDRIRKLQELVPNMDKQMLALQQSLLSGNRPQSNQDQSPNAGAAGNANRDMGLEMLMSMFGGLGAGGLTTPENSNVPPEELYATQLTQLQEMGFFDAQENIRALQATRGNVNAAVERILGNMGQ